MNDIGELYDLHAMRIKQFIANRVSNDEDVEDILHETFIRMANAKNKISVGDARKYLFTIARNIIIDRARRPKLFVSETSTEVGLMDWPSDDPSMEERLSVERDLKLLEAAIHSMSKRCQHAFVMRVFHGYSHLEIAKSMNISIKTVEKHLSKGFVVCRQYMKGKDAPVMPSERRNVDQVRG